MVVGSSWIQSPKVHSQVDLAKEQNQNKCLTIPYGKKGIWVGTLLDIEVIGLEKGYPI